MPYINYPSIPSFPGVPDLKRIIAGGVVSSGILSTILGTSGLLAGLLAQQWAILDDSGAQYIVPDTVFGFAYRGTQHITSHPVEMGTFSSINKVAIPFDIRMTLCCAGNQSLVSSLALGYMLKTDFLAQLESMLNDVKLYYIATPDAIYRGCNLVHYDYERTARSGASMIIADLYFQEVREKGVVTLTGGTSNTQTSAATSAEQTSAGSLN